MSTSLILIITAGMAVPFVVLGIVYRLVFQPQIRVYFGEEFSRRRDREASRRRKWFEGHCTNAAACLYFSLIAGVLNGLSSATIPILDPIARIIQIATVILFLLFAWAALYRWKRPNED